MSSQILRHLRNDFNILLLQEINHTPILSHVYAYGSATKATIVSNMSQDKPSGGEQGFVFLSAPPGSPVSFPLSPDSTQKGC